MLIKFLLLMIVTSAQSVIIPVSIQFVAQKGIGLNNSSSQTAFLIIAYRKQSKFQCLEECKNIKLCLVAVFDKSLNCMLYSKNFQIPDKQSSSSSDLFIKHFTRSSTIVPDLHNTFLTNVGVKTMISGFVDLKMFEFVYVDNQIFIYAAEGTVDQVIMIDENWNIVRRVNYPGLISIKVINNMLFISTDTALLKTDLNFNMIKVNSMPYKYHRITYDYDTATLILTSPNYDRLDFYDLNLIKIKSRSENEPRGLVYYGDKIYVSQGDNIRVYSGTLLIRSFDTACMSDITSLYADQLGYLATVCVSGSKIFLNNLGGTKIDQIITPTVQQHLTYDINGICYTNSATSIYSLI